MKLNFSSVKSVLWIVRKHSSNYNLLVLNGFTEWTDNSVLETIYNLWQWMENKILSGTMC